MSKSDTRARNLALASSFAVLAACAAFGTPALAQDAPVATAPVQQSGLVARIVVQGNERIDQSTVLSYLPIQPGDMVDPERIDLAVKTLFRTDLFADVEIGLVGTDLVVRVVENPIINQVVFEGNGSLSEEKLRDEVTVRPRGIFTRSRVQQDVQRIVELYRRSGRISATVSPKIVELPQKRVDLVFEIDEGPKTGVRRINILGNRAFSDGDLREEMVTKESQWWRFLSSNTNYDPDRIEYDREQLRKFYTNRGYYDFRVVSSVAELTPDREDFAVTVTVDEGDQYKFGEVKVETDDSQKLDPAFLHAILPIRSGQLYQSDRIEDATDALTFAAGSAGYAFVDIRPRYKANKDTDTVDVTFQVREGPRVYVERIDVVGNVRTIDPVIRRELLLSEGDAYNKVLLDRSRNNVRRLGFFKDVTIEEQPGSAPDRTVVQVNVEEQPTGELSFGAGFSSVDQFIVDLGVTERNFRGRGQDLRLRLSLGSLRQQIDFGFTEPRFMGRDLRAGVDLYSYRFDFSNESSFETQSTGGSLRLTFPLNAWTYLQTRYDLRNDEIVVDDVFCGIGTTSTLCQQRGSFLTSLAGFTLNVDRRNDPLNPTRGWRGFLRQGIAGLGGDVNYLKTEMEGAAYYGIRPKWVVSGLVSAGYVSGWNGDDVRISDRFFKGGNSFRGFETAGIGPRDLTREDALGGNAFAIGTIELAFPTGLPEEYGISAALFADVGTLGILDDRYLTTSVRDDLSLRAAAGLSVKWRSPMGPIRFDFSQILAKEDYDKTETFRFSTSTQF
ncbi:MAG TPA: outer membrane protein assembly factor BamA [Caulobacteraceae bacterium]|nr:outer membrane protein assembly factor BamA [Caulobacteraceae bacterium]